MRKSHIRFWSSLYTRLRTSLANCSEHCRPQAIARLRTENVERRCVSEWKRTNAKFVCVCVQDQHNTYRSVSARRPVGLRYTFFLLSFLTFNSFVISNVSHTMQMVHDKDIAEIAWFNHSTSGYTQGIYMTNYTIFLICDSFGHAHMLQRSPHSNENGRKTVQRKAQFLSSLQRITWSYNQPTHTHTQTDGQDTIFEGNSQNNNNDQAERESKKPN